MSAVADSKYPVRIDGTLDANLSRWLWLVKWILAIPHFVILAFLWAAMALLTIAAGVAVFFTGRYPPSIFAVNLGVLRWTWRVQFYAFTLGTDRYPPFTLGPVPDYPARLEVDYPAEPLSRGLVLVKWWLLAIPHYLVVSVFGGGLTVWTQPFASDDSSRAIVGGGLIGVLVLIAAVGLAFTGRYLPSLFDLVMGMHRWTYRVVAYAALMRDEYPPFRLDTGGDDPGWSSGGIAPAAPPGSGAT